MYPGNQAAWQPFAEVLAENGYRVLTFDFRGYGESEGERSPETAPAEMRLALDFLRENQAEQIVIIGAGMGGVATIKVAGQEEGVIGIAILSSPRYVENLLIIPNDLAVLNIPSLWIGTRTDINSEVESLYEEVSSEDKSIWIYEGSSLPGTFIFEGADGEDLERRLLEFVARVMDGEDEE